jgi:hypothetical protein
MPFSAFNNPAPAPYPPISEPFQFSAGAKPEEQRPFAKPGNEPLYSDTVKRHLEVFDAEIGLGEVRLSTQLKEVY